MSPDPQSSHGHTGIDPHLICQADQAAAHVEAVGIGEYRCSEARKLWGRLPPALRGIEMTSTMPAPEAEEAFLLRFKQLSELLEASTEAAPSRLRPEQ